MAEVRHAAFLRTADYPPANQSTYQALKAAFPDVTFDLIEVNPLLKRELAIAARNTLETVRSYGSTILRRKRSFREGFMHTSYAFKTIQRLLRQQLSRQTYDFTFQMQSIFDASQPGTPHFLYTDHTHLANLHYPDFDHAKLYTRDWIELERSIYHRATMSFVRSSNIARSIVEQYGVPPEKVACVYAGSNALTDKPFNEAKYASKQILFVGIDWERKGGPQLVAAFRRVLEQHPDAGLTIIGCTPELELPNCRILGRLPLHEVAAYYEQAAVFCLPTRIEPFGIVFVEAMSHRLPLVAARTGAVPDFVLDGQTGYLLELDDVEGLARALGDLLGNPERCRAFGAAAHKLALERYSWENVGRAMRRHIEASMSQV
jgi:glycosyltransferase involved in cell wall biosynthesis